MREFYEPNLSSAIKLSEVEAQRERPGTNARRKYIDMRNRYREWTLARLAKIEADES